MHNGRNDQTVDTDRTCLTSQIFGLVDFAKHRPGMRRLHLRHCGKSWQYSHGSIFTPSTPQLEHVSLMHCRLDAISETIEESLSNLLPVWCHSCEIVPTKSTTFARKIKIWYDSWGLESATCILLLLKIFASIQTKTKLDPPSMGEGVIAGFGYGIILFSTAAVCRFSATHVNMSNMHISKAQ